MLNSEQNVQECDATGMIVAMSLVSKISLTNILHLPAISLHGNRFTCLTAVRLDGKNTDCKTELSIFARPYIFIRAPVKF
jgi:hypothetical protein